MNRGMAGLVVVALVATSGCGAAKEANKIRNLANGKTAERIQKFSDQVKKSETLVYTADYKSTSSSGTSTVHVAQKPPKSVYKSGDSVFINDGANFINCSPQDQNGTKKMQCIQTPGGGGDANVAVFAQGLSGAFVVGGLALAALVPGIDASESTRKVAGQDLDCETIKVTDKGTTKTSVYCITKDGILGYVDTGDGDTFELTSFEKKASDSEFTPPATPKTMEQLQNEATTTTESTTTTTEDTTTTTSTPDTTSTTDTTAP